MKAMTGKIHPVAKRYDAKRDDRIHIGGYVWHVDDIIELKHEQREEVFRFDERKLVI